ncbi:NAD(P)H-hydrate dehydratase [bacterium]|nr:NAD(P)H-hydrate dehydratase [bacterium]
MKVVTPGEMQEIDKRAFFDFGMPPLILMENAGIAAASVCFAELEKVGGRSVTVFCGPGNNGGDGFVVARHLFLSGVSVKCLVVSAEKQSQERETNYKIVEKLGIPIITDLSYQVAFKMITRRQGGGDGSILNSMLEEPTTKLAFEGDLVSHSSADVFVDGLLGHIYKPSSDEIAACIDFMNNQGVPIISLDIPSGLCGERGIPLGATVKADITITFGLPKVGLLTYPGAGYAGNLIIEPISFPQELLADPKIRRNMLTEEEAALLLPKRPLNTHKGQCGKVAVIAGSLGMTGAALLCSKSAFIMGAGLVWLGIPESLAEIIGCSLIEVVTKPLPETKKASLSVSAYNGIMEIVKKADVLVIGPGIGRHPETRKLINSLVERVNIPIVLDADGIYAIEDLSILKDKKILLTPHSGETAHLLGKTVDEIEQDRIGVAERLSDNYNISVLLKGARTIIVSEGQTYINPTGCSGMAKAGSGDVLAGMIAALIGQGTSIKEAAVLGAYLHGSAGEEAVAKKTEYSIIASDIIDHIPEAIKRLRYRKS